MYLNHVESFQRLIFVLRSEVTRFPSSWQLHPPSWPAPTWIQAAQNGLRVVELELSDTYVYIKKTRELVSMAIER